MNKIELRFSARIENEPFVRTALASFILPLNPTLSQINEVKTAVSEAITNAIVHGYPDTQGVIELECEIKDGTLHILVKDSGVGIEDLSIAMQPFYSTMLEEERAGMGFTIMKTFMDSVEVNSKLNEGTTVFMTKTIAK